MLVHQRVITVDVFQCAIRLYSYTIYCNVWFSMFLCMYLILFWFSLDVWYSIIIKHLRLKWTQCRLINRPWTMFREIIPVMSTPELITPWADSLGDAIFNINCSHLSLCRGPPPTHHGLSPTLSHWISTMLVVSSGYSQNLPIYDIIKLFPGIFHIP